MAIFIVWIVCVIATAILAANKGRGVGAWLLLAILLGPLALLLAAVVSNKDIERQAAEAAAARTAEQARLRTCPFCAERIQRQAVVCRFCGKDVPAEPELRALPLYREEESLPEGSAPRGWVYIAGLAIVGVVLIYAILKSDAILKSNSTASKQDSSPTSTATTDVTTPVVPGEPSPQQQAYVTICNKFAWRGDKVQCEAAPERTLRIYQQAHAPRGDSEADTVKYLINHPVELKTIKRAGFDKINSIVLGDNGPGRNSNVTMSVGDDGKFKVLKICYDGTDNQRHCDPSN